MELTSTTSSQAKLGGRKPRGPLLTDALSVRLQLVEDDTSGKFVVRGEFARSGAATENKRVYPQTLWEREIRRLGKSMTDRKLFGELDHPQDGRTMLARVSHLVTGLRLEDGIVVGDAEIVDTDRGRNLKALLKAGARVGVSSRGYGSTRTNEDGQEIVQDDYQLVTFDFVAEPADNRAYPSVVSESKEPTMGEAERVADEKVKSEQWARMLATETQKVREQTETTLREEFATSLLEKIQAMRVEVTEQVRSELLSDPGVGGARTALDKVREVLRPYLLPEDAEGVIREKEGEMSRLRKESADKDLRIATLVEENEKLSLLAKEAGYKFFMEKAVFGESEEDAALIRKLIGDVKRFGSAAELKVKVEAIKSDLASKRARVAKVQEEKDREIQRSVKVEKAQLEQTSQVTEALEKSLALNKELALRLYAEKRLANHPKAATIRQVLESAMPGSEKEIDEVFTKFRAPQRAAEEIESVRARIRGKTGGGLSSTPLQEETPVAPLDENYQGLGVPLSELREMSGIRRLTEGRPASSGSR